MSHTPGPWYASDILDDGRRGVIDRENQIIVGLSAQLSFEDAALIAAAPEMYEALKAMQLRYPHLESDATDKMDAAIAKAEGA